MFAPFSKTPYNRAAQSPRYPRSSDLRRTPWRGCKRPYTRYAARAFTFGLASLRTGGRALSVPTVSTNRALKKLHFVNYLIAHFLGSNLIRGVQFLNYGIVHYNFNNSIHRNERNELFQIVQNAIRNKAGYCGNAKDESNSRLCECPACRPEHLESLTRMVEYFSIEHTYYYSHRESP